MVTTDPDAQAISMLYVEDEEESRELLAEIIKKYYPDIQLHIADNGKTGIKLFKKFCPEIVIADINMPLVDGIRMSTEIKAICPSTEIILLTAYSDTQYLLQAIEIGISNYILKPIDINQLLKVVNKTIDRIRAAQEAVRQNNLIMSLNRELAQRTQELETANKELEAFSYTVAHDLCSPMVSISGYAEILLDQKASCLDNESKGYLGFISNEITRMSTLVDVLLKFSVYKRAHLNKSLTSLSRIAEEIMAGLMLQEPERQLEFSQAAEMNAFCDPGLMRIVLENLLQNAWKYSSKTEGARIEFGCSNREEDCVYFVRDNGAGFDQQEADKLFVPFQRLQTDADIQGFGVGLATVQRIIQRHGGRIWAEGVKGKGATFFFTL